jgi:hypothetical protein
VDVDVDVDVNMGTSEIRGIEGAWAHSRGQGQ